MFIPSSYFTVQLFRKCFFFKVFLNCLVKKCGWVLFTLSSEIHVCSFFFLLKYTSLLYQQLTFGRVRLIFCICMQQERFCTLFQSMAIRCLYIKLHMQSMAFIFIGTFVKSSTLAIFSRERSEELALADNDPAYVGFGCNFGSAFSGDKNWWVWWKFGVLLADNIRLLLMEESFSSPVIKQFANFIIKPYKFFILFWLANFCVWAKWYQYMYCKKKIEILTGVYFSHCRSYQDFLWISEKILSFQYQQTT